MTAFQQNQQAVSDNFTKDPFVAVFAVNSQNIKPDETNQEEVLKAIKNDAIVKATAMIESGVTKIEFLARGQKGVDLDAYIEQVLQAISELKVANPTIQFGVGTVSSVERMRKICAEEAVDFVVTAHQPNAEMVQIALEAGKPIVSTVSKGAELKFENDGQTVGPAGAANELDVDRIKDLRAKGIEAIKIFDFGKIGEKRAGKKTSAEDKTIFGLVAIAEALIASYDGNVPDGKNFAVMTTGGIDMKTLPFAVAGVKNPDIKAKIEQILAGTGNAAQVIDILGRTTVGVGGTFTTKEYDELAKAGKFGEANQALQATCRDAKLLAQLAQEGVVPSRKKPHTVLVGEPLIQFKKVGEAEPEFLDFAGDNANLARTWASLQKALGGKQTSLSFAGAFGNDEFSAKFKEQLRGFGIDLKAFSVTMSRELGNYTLNCDAEGNPLTGPARNSYDRDNAPARQQFHYLESMKRSLIVHGATQVVGSLISLGNCDDREAQLEFFRFAHAQGIEVIWSNNYRPQLWENPAQAAEFSARAMKYATKACVSFDDEQKMFGDRTPQDTVKRIHGYGVKEVTVTNEAEKIIVSLKSGENNKQHEVEPAPLKDGNRFKAGAGDNFAAAYLYARQNGYAPEAAAKFASVIAAECIANPRDYLKDDEIPKKTELKLGSHPAVVSVRYFYRDPLDSAQENILGQIQNAKGITGITTSLHSIPREQAFTAWDVVKLVRHVEFKVDASIRGDKDPIELYSKDEQGALMYLSWLNAQATSPSSGVTRTGVYIMNFEDSRTSDNVKYGLDGRDADIAVEKENLRVLSACGLNSKDRPGFCYTTNFMTPFDWFRTHMDFELPDGSKAMAIQTELVAMFDRYVLDIEPQTSGYYEQRYGNEVMQKAEALWRDTYGEDPNQSFVADRVRQSYKDGTRKFIDDMLKGKAGSSEAQGFTLATFRQQVKDARYMGQERATACFENDKDGAIAHAALQEHLKYYGEQLAPAVEQHGVRVVLHPDDTTSTKGNRGDLGVPRVASTAEDILHMYEAKIGMNLCTGCFGSSMLVNSEADIIAEGIRLIRDKYKDADLTDMYPFLHLRKVLRGNENLEGFNQNPEIQAYLKEVQKRLGDHPESIAELPHHVALTPLFKTLQVLHQEKMLWDVRPDHTPSLGFYMDYKTGKIEEGQLGQPGYDASRIMAGQEIRIMLDAMHNLESESARKFVEHFEIKLCSFGLDKNGDRQRLSYLRELDFGKALMQAVNEQGFKPVFNSNVSAEVAQAIVSGKPIDATVTMLTEQQRVAAARAAA